MKRSKAFIRGVVGLIGARTHVRDWLIGATANGGGGGGIAPAADGSLDASSDTQSGFNYFMGRL